MSSHITPTAAPVATSATRIRRPRSNTTSPAQLATKKQRVREENMDLDDMFEQEYEPVELTSEELALLADEAPLEHLSYASEPVDNGCRHEDTEIINGIIECVYCGERLDQVVDQEQEWRYYGASDNKNSSDPSRCQSRKVQEKGIRKFLEKFSLPQQVINLADQYYQEVTLGEIKRGKMRLGIIYACVFEAYWVINKLQLPNQLLKMFGIDKKTAIRGSHYFLRRRSKSDRKYITAEHFIPKICALFNFTKEAIDEVLSLYQEVVKKSSNLDHSYPQSVSCGLVYYMMKSRNVDISAEDFGKQVELSAITVAKKSQEIESILSSSD